EFDPESNIVDVYIRYLRQKIGLSKDKPLIETVRGAGYRVVTD
ncbi:MAG TPA: winged helix family transcriptional regulator, partial [Actinobacteria bacterium]|nr:winged helix family transcriptional regulator [Actinomycetes bacterium]HEX21197.1 winged helix family transcriptional regulator [Actinomycetota bacterium]